MAAEPDTAIKEIKSFDSTYVVVVTRGHLKDEEELPSVIDHRSKYIGIIGSKKRMQLSFNF